MSLNSNYQELARRVDGMLAGDPNAIATGVSTDTRSLRPGDIFVALIGENHDGHAHIAAAAEKGASGCVVSKPLSSTDPQNLPSILVTDTRAAYAALAKHVRDNFAGPVVGVTGSVGKTTVKEMIATILECAFSVHKSAANFNNEIGLPKTLLETPESATALVLEMGMRGAGQIAHLARTGRPTIGVITGVGLSHIELLGSRQNIARAKAELFDAIPADTGVCIFPATDDFAQTLRERARGKVLTVALDSPADISATDLVKHENGWRATVASPWGNQKIFVPSPGRFNVQNALLAIAVGGTLGIALDVMAKALLRYEAPAMRLQVVKSSSGATVLADAYNAAPDSMLGALSTLAETPVGASGKRIAVLGEMKELGSYAAEAHKMVGRVAAKLKIDTLVLVGEATKNLSAAAIMAGMSPDQVHYFDTSSQAAQVLPIVAQNGDVVLVKGSRAMAMEGIIVALVPDFSREAHS